MHVLVATAGVLSPEPVADLVQQLVGETGRVSVISVIEVPHAFLELLRAEEWRPVGIDVPWPSDEEAWAARYVEERGRRLVEPIMAALRSRRIPCQPVFRRSDDPARAIVEAAEDLGAHLIVLGATRSIFDESTWKSVSATVIQESRLPVLVIPAPQKVEERVTGGA